MSTASQSHPLDVIDVASPCTADWDQMIGSEQIRFCSLCKLNVYNLSEMSRQEAEQLILEHEGRLCARFYRRHDGTVITRDCPIGLRAVRQKVVRAWLAIAALLGFLMLAPLLAFSAETRGKLFSGRDPFAKLQHWMDPPVPFEMIMGDVCEVPPLPVITPPPPSSN